MDLPQARRSPVNDDGNPEVTTGRPPATSAPAELDRVPGVPDRFLNFAAFAVENLSDGAHLITKEGIIVYVNQAACQMMGYTREEMVGMSMMKVNPTINQEIWDAIWIVTEREKKQTIETEHLTKDGRRIPLEVLANYLEFDGAAYSCAFTRDITERRMIERRLRQSEKMEAIGQLAGGIAHDFNNQLAGIVGYAELLRNALADRPALAGYAEAILRAADRSSDLTRQLLAFSRRGKYLSAPVDLHQILGEVVLMLERSIDKRIVIKSRLLAECAVVKGDPSQLENALLNLAINARDAMPDGGLLVLSTEVVALDEAFCAESPFQLSPGPHVKVVVADTGVGMDEAIQVRLFEPFFTTKEAGRGTGMGLAAVYGTVKSHQGAVTVHSEPNRGTQVTLYFPLERSPAGPKNQAESVSPATPLAARVLLVDDEASVRETTAKMLTDLGCRVTTAADGEEALALFERVHQDIDLVILDLIMPKVGGRETFLGLRRIEPNLAVLLSSGYSVEGEVQAILELGARGFIEKPFRAADLACAIAAVLSDTAAR